jgi:general stress protein YciG
MAIEQEEQSHSSRGSGNFANDPKRASEAGKKGGEHSHSGSHGESGGRSGSSDRPDKSERTSDVKEKSGEQTHGRTAK